MFICVCVSVYHLLLSSNVFLSFIDLQPAFHWNLKQLFVFIVAEYETKTNVCSCLLHVHSLIYIYLVSYVNVNILAFKSSYHLG